MNRNRFMNDRIYLLFKIPTLFFSYYEVGAGNKISTKNSVVL